MSYDEYKRLYNLRKARPEVGDYAIIGGMPCQITATSYNKDMWVRTHSLIIKKDYDLNFSQHELTLFTPLISTQRVISTNPLITDVEKFDDNGMYDEFVVVLAVPMCIAKWETKKIIASSFSMDC